MPRSQVLIPTPENIGMRQTPSNSSSCAYGVWIFSNLLQFSTLQSGPIVSSVVVPRPPTVLFALQFTLRIVQGSSRESMVKCQHDALWA